MRLFYADTPDEIRIALGTYLLNQGNAMIQRADYHDETRKTRPRNSLTKTEAAGERRAGQILRMEGETLLNHTTIKPISAQKFGDAS